MKPLRRLAVTALLALPLGLCGCPVAAWLAAQFAPPEKVDAKFEIPKDKSIVVFVDDIVHEVSYQPLKSELTRKLNQKLQQHKIAREIVPYERLQHLAATAPDFNLLHVPNVGQRVGADLVLYVEINHFSLKDDPNSPLWRGCFRTTVKVVDSQAGRIWPEDRPGGYPVPTVVAPNQDNPSPDFGIELANLLAEQMADRVAKLFYQHEVPAQGVRSPFEDETPFSE